jgi:hypothetical protein
MRRNACTRSGCANEARWFPVLLLYADRRQYPMGVPARAVLGLPTCDACKAGLRVSDVLSDDGWAQIVSGFRGAQKVVPHRADTELTFTPLNSDEACAFQRMRGH